MANQGKKRKEFPPYSRLMDILFQCANRGVKIYILIYKENTLSLTINSAHSQKSLEALYPNIQVERYNFNSDFLWSVHEKLVIIDQIIGYVGGLGLCWGRWDTYYFPGIDYSNARIRDFDKVENYIAESCKRKEYELRMPCHGVHSRLVGAVVADFTGDYISLHPKGYEYTSQPILHLILR